MSTTNLAVMTKTAIGKACTGRKNICMLYDHNKTMTNNRNI